MKSRAALRISGIFVVRRGLAAVVLATALGACGNSSGSGASSGASSEASGGSNSGSSRVSVVAAENFWGNIAAQIGGKYAQVTSIISDPNADPHEYETSAANAAAVAKASIVIVNGLGYDDFMSQLLGADSGHHPAVITAATVLHIAGDDPNPHLWYDVPRVPAVAAAIEAALAAADPTDASLFASNLRVFDNSLAPIDAVIASIKGEFANTPVAYTERVPGYLIGDAGLADVTPPGFARSVEDGNDPSPSDTKAMDTVISTHAAKVLLYNVQTVSSTTNAIESLAKADGVPIVGVSETLPAGDTTFQQWQLAQVKALQMALGG